MKPVSVRELNNQISKLLTLSVVKENFPLSKRLTGLGEKMQSGQFQLVVLGQFKRGKTTLINALLGVDLLPTAVVPLTSIVTRTRYGLKEKASVIFLNGQTKAISFSELDNFVTEVKNPKNEKGVDEVIIEYPSGYLNNGLEIVDTPGVGSVYRHNTDVAYEFVPKADAGIFVVTTDPPISDVELQFLTSIKDFLGKIFFVQNKIDQVADKDVKESLEFTKKAIEEKVGVKDFKIHPLSAKRGLDGKVEKDDRKLEQSKLAGFEAELNRFMVKEKEEILLASISRKLLTTVDEINLSLQIEKQALLTPTDALKEKIATFDKELENIKQEKEDADFILQGQLDKLTKQVLIEDIEVLKEKKLPILLQDTEQFYSSNKHLSGTELATALDSFLEKSIKSIFSEWRKQQEEKLAQALKSILSRFTQEANESIRKVVDLSADLFNLQLKPFKVETELAGEFEFRFSFDEVPVELDLFTPLVSHLPKFLSHGLLYDNIKKQVAEQFDRHCGRSRYDFHQRVLKSVTEYKNKLDEIFEETTKSIELAMKKSLSEKEKSAKEAEELMPLIIEQEETLAQVKMDLEKLLS